MPAPKDKKKFLLWAYPSTLELVKNNYRKDKCKSQSEFIERAIQYYVGHVTVNDDTSYLPNAFLSNMKSIVAESDNRHSKMLQRMQLRTSEKQSATLKSLLRTETTMQNICSARFISTAKRSSVTMTEQLHTLPLQLNTAINMQTSYCTV